VLVAAPAAASTRAAASVHATLASASQPRALGVFVGRLSGRALTWRLTYNGVDATPLSASIRVPDTKPLIVRLCGPCATGAFGRVTLSGPVASAVQARVAFVDLRTRKGAISGLLDLGTVPTLQVELGDGATLHLPAAIHYAVSGLTGRTHVALLTGGRTLDLTAAAGVLTLPDDKMLTGKRDLTFVLERADGTRLANREARVTVYGVLLAGRR
jgi:hypothetical protein